MRSDVDQLLLLLQRRTTGDDVPGYSLVELCEATGISRNAMGIRLRELGRAGKLTVARRPSMRIDGLPSWTPVYRFKDVG